MISDEKIPFKRAELSVKKFNEVAIPHHLGLLSNHKSNIEKQVALGDWTKVKKEEINATRVIKQIKNLLLEMDVLRSKIQDQDVDKFDDVIAPGRKKALDAIRDYLSIQLKSPVSTKSNSPPCEENDSELIDDNLPQLQIEFQPQEHQLRARQACLEEFESLQREVEDLYGTFQKVSEIVNDQGESVNIIADNAEEALENVNQGEMNLATALKYKKAMYPMVGAVIGTLVGGPIGLIAGIKAGGLAAVGCGLLGFTGGTVLKKNEVTMGVTEPIKEE